MKNISDRKMPMNRGEVDSDGYFPGAPEHKKLGRVGEISKNFKYPDTEESVMRDSEQAVKETSRNLPKPGFRH